MKLVLHLVLFLVLVTRAFSAVPEVDFDGRSKKTKVEVTRPNSVLLLPAEVKVPNAEQEAKARVDLLVEDNSGKWIPAEPIQKNDTFYYKTAPGSKYMLRWVCSSNGTSSWSFSSAYSLAPWKKGDSPGHSHIQGISTVTYTSGAPLPNPLFVNNLAQNVDYIVNLKAFDFATRIIWTSNFGGACDGQSGTVIVDIKEDGLSPMPEGTNPDGYVLGPVATAASHPSIQNVTSGFGRALLRLGAVWRDRCPNSRALVYQRMSLPWGGIYDRDLNWKEPYYGHNKGIAVDILKKAVLKGDMQGLINLMCNQGFKVYSEQDLTDNHYHITLRDGGGDVNWSGATPCCIKEYGEYPSPAACLSLAQKEIEAAMDSAPCGDLPAYQDVKPGFQ